MVFDGDKSVNHANLGNKSQAEKIKCQIPKVGRDVSGGLEEY